MKAEEISDAIGRIDEELIAGADEKRTAAAIRKRRKRTRFLYSAAAVACAVCVLGTAFLLNGGISGAGSGAPGAGGGISGGNGDASADTTGATPYSSGGGASALSGKVQVLAAANYPEAAQYPDESAASGKKFDDAYSAWSDDARGRQKAAEDIDSSIFDFYKASARAIIPDTGGENYVYSPVNVYMALSMLAGTTDGSSRAQLLDLLNAQDADALKRQAKNLWAANYQNDGAVTSVTANSLWLDENTPFSQDTVDSLAENYFASVYRGDLSSEDMTRALQSWLDGQTCGLLKQAAGQASFAPDTVMELSSAVCFRAKWNNQFNKERNDVRTFHGAAGDTGTEFMNADLEDTFYTGSGFCAVRLRFVDSGAMWLILPDEGKTPEDIIKSGDYLDMISSGEVWADQKPMTIHASVPKFEVSSDISLKESLAALGVTDIFDRKKADFSPLTGGNPDGLSLGGARHAARVVIDEEGCTAAAFTEMALTGDAMPPGDETDFVLDRPFLFVITGDTGHPLFIGTVNKL